MELIARFHAFEADFNSQVMIDYAREHTEIPVFAVGAYLWMIFGLPELLPARACRLRRAFTAWNAALAAFSLAGASRVLPHLLRALGDPAHGGTLRERFVWTCAAPPRPRRQPLASGAPTPREPPPPLRPPPLALSAAAPSSVNRCCTDPAEWYLIGPTGLWVGLFIFSKLPELFDTAFLVLQKKKVIFLHWFHHTTVLLYCWHAYHNRIGPGIWCARARARGRRRKRG